MSDRDSNEIKITPELLLRAYAAGMFPMAQSAQSKQIHWFEPEKRGIIPLNQFHLPRSLKKTIKSNIFEIRVDCDFQQVLEGCSAARDDRPETWINDQIKALYLELHKMGHAHTIETWLNGKLVGGLYGVCLGCVFFGESMFSLERDASKVALCDLVARMKAGGFQLLDTQFTTDHLKRFGAIEISADKYKELLTEALCDKANFFPKGFAMPDQDGGGTSSDVCLHVLSQIS